MIRRKTVGAQGQRRYSVHLLCGHQGVSATLSSRIEATSLTTSTAPTHRGRPGAGTFCGNEGVKDQAVSDKSRQKRLQQIRWITVTYRGAVL